jgi:signal transduction histidine kinase
MDQPFQEQSSAGCQYSSAARGKKLEAMGLLAAGVVHDFKNVLTVIGSTLSLLDRRDIDDPMRVALMQETRRSLERGKDLAQQLLGMSRDDRSASTSLKIADLIRHIRPMLAIAAGPDIRIDCDIEQHLPPFEADRNRAELTLLNLVINARDAMPSGGVIRIAVQMVPAWSVGIPRSYLHISVQDNGVGMDDQTVEKASELFFTTKPPGSGTGMGLWLAKSFATDLGGSFSLSSTQDVGTTVELWLPALALGPGDGGVLYATAMNHTQQLGGRL